MATEPRDTIRTTIDLDANLHYAIQALIRAGRVKSMREFIRMAVPYYMAHLADVRREGLHNNRKGGKI